MKEGYQLRPERGVSQKMTRRLSGPSSINRDDSALREGDSISLKFRLRFNATHSDVACTWAEQKRDDLGDLHRVAHAAHWYRLEELGIARLVLLPQVMKEGSVNGAW